MDSSGDAPQGPVHSQYSDKHLPETRPPKPGPPTVEVVSRWLSLCPVKNCEAVYQLASDLRKHLNSDEHKNLKFRENTDGSFTVNHEEESTSPPPKSNHRTSISIKTQPSTSLPQTPEQKSVAIALQKAMADLAAMPPPSKSSKSKKMKSKKKTAEVEDRPEKLSQEIISSDAWNFRLQDGHLVMFNTKANLAITFAPGTIREIHWSKASSNLVLFPSDEQIKNLGSDTLLFSFDRREDAELIRKGLARRDEDILFREELLDEDHPYVEE